MREGSGCAWFLQLPHYLSLPDYRLCSLYSLGGMPMIFENSREK